jgi:4-azaleucine resistance transporter AzlC
LLVAVWTGTPVSMENETRPGDLIAEQTLTHGQADSTGERKGFADGMRDCLPVVLGYVAIGLAFGVVARSTGLSVAEVALTSIILYAGSAQFVLAGLVAVAAPLPAVVITIFLVNLRHMLYSAALAPHVRLPLLQNALVGLELTDETFAVASSHLARGVTASGPWLFGINLTAQVTWVTATTVGALLGEAIPDTKVLGLDFALASMFAALLFLQIASRPKLVVAVVVALTGAAIAVAGTLVVPPSWAVIAAALVATTMGVLIEGKREAR